MARSTYSPRNLSHQIEKEKYQKESEIENSRTVPAVRNKASYVNDSPKETP